VTPATGAVGPLTAALAAAVPVDPDRPTARRWLLEELSRPEYSTDQTLLSRFVEWFTGLFEGLEAVAVSPGRLAVVVALVLGLVVAVAWWVAGPARLRRRTRPASAVVHGDDVRTAAQLTAAADDAAARGDWSLAVLERFRATVRGLEERAVLDERPGRTAREAADDAAARLPDLARDLHDAATVFDDVCYGHLPAGPADDATLRDLEHRVSAARPAVAAP